MTELPGFRFEPMPRTPNWMTDTLGLRLPNGHTEPIPVSVWLTHADFVHEILTRLQPKIVVEIGVFSGASLLVMRTMAHYYRMHTHFFGIDGWDGEQSGTDGWIWDGPAIEARLRQRTDRMRDVTLIKQRSEQAFANFDNGTIDLLHIDGDHREEGIRRDLELWLPKLAPRGVVLLHDIGTLTIECQVWKVWQELLQQYPTFSDTRAAGLGAFCPKGVDLALRGLIRPMIELT